MESLSLNNPSHIKMYFEEIMQLERTGEEFPVDFDLVWPLVYSRKDNAKRELINSDMFSQNVDYQVFRQNEENSKGGRPTEKIEISVSCLEYFIVRKVREVFDVYRQCRKAIASKPMSDLDLMELTIKEMKAQRKELGELNQGLNVLKSEVKRIDAKTSTRPDYYTVVGFATLNDFNVNIKIAASVGRKASALCKKRDIPVDSVKDPRFGKVGMYPGHILQEVFNRPLS